MLTRSLITFSCFVSIFCFNIDVDNVIVKRSVNGSLFGISVTPHIIKKLKASRILVGAPLASSGGVKGGGVFSCPFSATTDDCVNMNASQFTEGTGNDDVIVKEGQFLGVSTVSATPYGGEKAFACAPRGVIMNSYANTKMYPGRCKVIDNDLTGSKMVFIPKCPNNQAQLIMKFCMVGMSLSTNEHDDALIGAPFATKKVANDGAILLSTKADNYTSSTTRNINSTTSPTYFGWSVAMGRLYSSSESPNIVAGGPVLPNYAINVEHFPNFSSTQVGAGLVLTFKGTDAVQLLIGRQFASRFGHSLLVMDVNNDGWDDLLVGAPEFRTEDKAVPFGAVYLYLNDGGNKLKLVRTLHAPARSKGECKRKGCSKARFGFALSNLKDINMDGYADVGISAPGLDEGIIYVYHGASDGLSTQPVQALNLAGRNLTNLGWSLGPGMDLDQNGYPDLVAGAWDSAVVFRTRPIVKIEATVYFSQSPLVTNLSSNKWTSCPANSDIYSCLTVTVRVRYTPALKKHNLSITIPATVKVSSEPHSIVTRSRLYTGRYWSTSATKSFDLKRYYSDLQFTVGILKNKPIDKYNPINFTISWSFKPEKTEKLSDPIKPLTEKPVYDTVNNFKTKQLTWDTGCPPDGCVSDLQLFMSTSLRRDPDSPGRYVYFIGDSRDVWLNYTIKNWAGKAHFVRLKLRKPKEFSVKPSGNCVCQPPLSETELVTCGFFDPLLAGNSLQCNIKMSVIPNDYKPFNISADVETGSRNGDSYPTNVRVLTTVKLRAYIKMSGSANPSQLFIRNTNVIGASSIKHEIKIGDRRVTIKFKVENALTSVVKNSMLTILWPYEVAGDPKEKHGKYLLYLLKQPEIDTIASNKVVCDPKVLKKIVNPLGVRLLDPKKNNTRRYRREANQPIYTFPQVTDYQLCSKNRNSRCLALNCKIQQLGNRSINSVTVSLVARLWIHTLVEDIAEDKGREIVIAAKWNQNPDQPVALTNTSKSEVEVKLTAVNVMKLKAKPPKHFSLIIAAAAIGGIILFGCLVIILWKCNFFKRTNLRQKRMELLRESQMPRE